MRRQLTTPEEIKEEIVRMLQEERAHFKGKRITSVKDLPKRYTMPSYVNSKGERIKNKYWKKARTKLCNAQRFPAKSKPKFDTKVDVTIEPRQAFEPRQERVHTNNNTISITLPSGMSATALIDLINVIKKSGAKCSL